MESGRTQVSGRGPTFSITRGSFFATAGGEVSGVDSGDDDDDDDASAVAAASPTERPWYATFFPSGDDAALVVVPWPAGLRARSVMELGGMKALRFEDGSALRGSSRASRADVRSNHGGGVVSVVPSEDCGPRRFLGASFSNYFRCKSVSMFPHASRRTRTI